MAVKPTRAICAVYEFIVLLDLQSNYILVENKKLDLPCPSKDINGTKMPTKKPIVKQPTLKPTLKPTSAPTKRKRETGKPTKKPTRKPTFKPTNMPTSKPVLKPTLQPTKEAPSTIAPTREFDHTDGYNRIDPPTNKETLMVTEFAIKTKFPLGTEIEGIWAAWIQVILKFRLFDI